MMTTTVFQVKCATCPAKTPPIDYLSGQLVTDLGMARAIADELGFKVIASKDFCRACYERQMDKGKEART